MVVLVERTIIEGKGTVVSAFHDALLARGRSRSTARSYATAAGAFVQWAEQRGLELAAAGASAGNEWLEEVAQRSAHRTVVQRRHALAAFLAWAGQESTLARPSGGADRSSPPLPTVLEQTLRLIRGRSEAAVRDRALLHLTIGAGLSCAETSALVQQDFDLPQGVVRVNRGGGRRVVTIDARAVVAIEQQLAGGAGRSETWLGRKGPLTEHGIRRAVLARLAAAGAPQDIRLARARASGPATHEPQAPAPRLLTVLVDPTPAAGRSAELLRLAGLDVVAVASRVI
ncbi:MAG: site-specific integrase, partial [Dehalococcoidia bacterium]